MLDNINDERFDEKSEENNNNNRLKNLSDKDRLERVLHSFRKFLSN